MESQGTQNAYLDQVMVEQKQLENDLRGRRKMMNVAQANPQGHAAERNRLEGNDESRAGGMSSELAPGPAVDVRITGWWRRKNVIVPPNAYVVHTRRGEAEPVHCGLGISFKFDPVTDSFLVVPAAMQTIIINARSICKERQGILIQAYVQWMIEDWKTAYRKLDFTDSVDPMRVVNVQLREQAEAAIKDKVATLGVDEVLSDKQPIVRELTARLRHVAEGDGGGEGLGLRIVTVQIKEAIVSSARLWETLQRPFRAERAKDARLAELGSESIVRKREAEEAEARASAEIETQAAIAKRRADAEAQTFDRTQTERVRRAKIEAESLTATMASEKEQIERLAVLSRAKLEHQLAEAQLRSDAQRRVAEQEIALDAARRKVANDLSPIALDMKVIETLPAIAEKMPHPTEHRSISIGSDGVAALVTGVKQLVEAVRTRA